MKTFAKNLLVASAGRLTRWPWATRLPRWYRGRPGMLRVLTYHRVDWSNGRPDLCPSTLSATPPDFAAQMQCVRENFHPVGLEQVQAAMAGACELPAGSVLITFDDAYRDFAEHAWPVLRRLDLPATMFVPTAFPEQPERAFWWDRLHQVVATVPVGEIVETKFGRLVIDALSDRREVAAKLASQLAFQPHYEALAALDELAASLSTPVAPAAVLGWDELRKLHDDGLTLAPHTRTHPLMTRISLSQAREEVRTSRDDLTQQTGHSPPVFAFPGGACNDEHVRMLRQEGIEFAVTTCRGANDLRRSDPLRLRRINVGRRTTPALLTVQLALPAAVMNRLAARV